MGFTAHEKGASGTLYASDDRSPGNWVGYYLPANAVAGELPPTITLEDSWSEYWGNPRGHVNGGSYAFFPAEPPAGTADALAKLLGSLNHGYGGWAYRFVLWVTVPREGPLSVAGSIPFAQQGFSSVNGAVIQNAGLVLRTLEVTGDVGLPMKLAAETIVLTPTSTVGLHLMQTRGTPVEVGAVTSAGTLPLTGTTAGSTTFTMNLEVTAPDVRNDLSRLDSGVKYFYEHNGVVRSQRFPVLGLPTGASTRAFAVRVDPLNATDERRTRLTFADDEPFQSALRTTTGIPLTLAPVKDDAGFALAPDRVTPLGTTKQIDAYCAALSGAFVIAAPGNAPAGPLPLLCGLAGLEAITVNPARDGYGGDRLTFHPGGAAFAPGFPPKPLSLDDSGSVNPAGPRLDTKMTTAWATLDQAPSPPAGPAYLAQPAGAPLFSGTAELGFLPLLEQANAEPGQQFPIAAYAGVSADGDPDGFAASDVPVYEQTVVSPSRRAAMTPVTTRATLAAMNGGGQATTPQGFLVTLGTGGTWSTLLLAQTGAQALEFAPVDGDLQAALQTNQLFLVATAATWSPSAFKNQVQIEAWPFELDVGQNQTYGDYTNVMILKFCGDTLRKLVADPRRWTAADKFNRTAADELLAVSGWLTAYFEDAARRTTDPSYAHFNQIADDPSWRGILCLRVNVPTKDLPAQVSALRAGIAGRDFQAHHLGIEVSKVDTSAGLSMSGTSSLFGLIDYTDPAYAQALQAGGSPDLPVAPAPGLTYDFKVLRLLVSFENSEVKGFQSKCQVTLNALFGDPVLTTTIGSGGTITNSIVIDGVLQHHDDQPVYVFSSSQDTLFGLDSNVLPSVEVVSTALATLSDSESGGKYRFTFAGYLAFAALPGLDALSFGPEGKSAPNGIGLSYSNLFLDLDYDDAAAQPRTFTFDASRIALDQQLSTARPASLFASLPLKLRALTTGGKGGPQQAGFLAVKTPDLEAAAVGDTWYGLVLDLDLGGPGALAAQAGWTVGLMLAWSAGSTSTSARPRAFVGLQLPGAAPGAKQFSLQGVIKLSIESIQLRQLPGGPYLLQMNQLALKLLALSFPPSGSTAFYLFGNPGSKPGERSDLAWYAAYANPTKALT